MSEITGGGHEAVYPLTEAMGDDVRSGNYIFPGNFRSPDFCEGCPLAEGLREPRISQVKGLYPVRGDGVVHIGSFRDYVSDVLVLSDASNSEFEPVYLGEVPIVSPFSVEHEDGDSQALGYAHSRVSSCESPGETKKLFRSPRTVCLSGLTKVRDHHQLGYRLRIDEETLALVGNVVVGEKTEDEMARLLQSAQAHRADGRSLREPEVNLEHIEAMHRLALSVRVA